MRPLQEKDAEIVERLENTIFPNDNLGAWAIAREIKVGGGYIIEEGGQPCAYILLRFFDSGSYTVLTDILRLGVLYEKRRQGLAKRLLERIQGPAMLTVRKDNAPALRLYHAHNFKIVGELSESLLSSWVMHSDSTRPKGCVARRAAEDFLT